ncbi:MAG TPA: DUF1203 domain-containing protein [Terriglobales bacterium]
MPPIRVIAIPTKTADLVRKTLKSPGYGHPAHTELATGYGPCRHCLRDFRIGEEQRILFTYDAFYAVETLPLPGPVFIHAEACDRYDETAGFPDDARSHRLTFHAYGANRSLLAEKLVEDGKIEPVIESLLTRADVRYLQVRDTQAGCYDFRIERAQTARD